jgi:hypothetical protein
MNARLTVFVLLLLPMQSRASGVLGHHGSIATISANLRLIKGSRL